MCVCLHLKTLEEDSTAFPKIKRMSLYINSTAPSQYRLEWPASKALGAMLKWDVDWTPLEVELGYGRHAIAAHDSISCSLTKVPPGSSPGGLLLQSAVLKWQLNTCSLPTTCFCLYSSFPSTTSPGSDRVTREKVMVIVLLESSSVHVQ